jgi:hypothetical protein
MTRKPLKKNRHRQKSKMGTGNQSTYGSPNALSPPTVSNSSIAVTGANPSRAGLYVFNPSATVTLWISPTGTAAAVNGAGSVAIQPLQGVMFGPPNTPPWTNGMNAIASAGGANVIVILEYYQ